jgi:hypothetical protein
MDVKNNARHFGCFWALEDAGAAKQGVQIFRSKFVPRPPKADREALGMEFSSPVLDTNFPIAKALAKFTRTDGNLCPF